jgi:hypothetical protein
MDRIEERKRQIRRGERIYKTVVAICAVIGITAIIVGPYMLLQKIDSYRPEPRLGPPEGWGVAAEETITKGEMASLPQPDKSDLIQYDYGSYTPPSGDSYIPPGMGDMSGEGGFKSVRSTGGGMANAESGEGSTANLKRETPPADLSAAAKSGEAITKATSADLVSAGGAYARQKAYENGSRAGSGAAGAGAENGNGGNWSSSGYEETDPPATGNKGTGGNAGNANGGNMNAAGSTGGTYVPQYKTENGVTYFYNPNSGQWGVWQGPGRVIGTLP